MAFLFGGVTLSDRSVVNPGADEEMEELDPLDDITNLDDSSTHATRKRCRRILSIPTNEMYRLELSGGSSTDGDMYWNKVDVPLSTAPPARWQHTAEYSDQLNGIIIFGGFGEVDTPGGSCRFNDLWTFDVKSESWSKPQLSFTSSIDSCPPWTSSPVSDSPAPRGAHASAIISSGSCLVVFGGYGGESGYTRRDLSDLHAFHIPSCQWHLVDTTGAPPARSGHKLLANLSDNGHDNLYVMGGWSASQQFDDVYVLENDGSSLTWSLVNAASGLESWGRKRWNFGAISVPAVPNWKIFVFGGNSGELDQSRPQGMLQNNIQVLECTSSQDSDNAWFHPDIAGDSPSPRSDTSIIYSKDSGKLFVFGGWSTQWLDDMYALNVSDIVGPPYNIFSVVADWDEATSPITGNTPLTISGQGFYASSGGSSPAVVKFASPKGVTEVNGDIKSDAMIKCLAPDFSAYDPDERVHVTVKIGANRFTNNALPFSFFSVTDSSRTVAFGPGLLSGIGKETETCFLIRAKDASSRDRVCGMDTFTIKIRQLDDEQPIVDVERHDNNIAGSTKGIAIVAGTKMKARAIRARARLKDEGIPYEIGDCNDGTYLVKYTPPNEGLYRVSIEFDGTFDGKAGPIRGSPFELDVTTTDDQSVNALNGSILFKNIESHISQLKEFSTATETGLGKAISADDLRSLISVKEHLRNLSQRKTSIENGIAANQSALLYLKHHSINLSSTCQFLQGMDSAIAAWTGVNAIVPKTIERIANVEEVWREKVRFKIQAYEKELEGKHEQFRRLPFWFYHQKISGASVKLGSEAARTAISHAQAELDVETRTLDENSYLCSIFELDSLIVASQKHLADMKSDLMEIAKLWDVSEKLEAFIDSSKQMQWDGLDFDALEGSAKKQLEKVKGLHKSTRWSDAFITVDKLCKDFLAAIPLMVLLGSKSMRPRHWKLLIQVTNTKNFTPPCDNEAAPLGDVLTIDLVKFSNEVEDICDQASKEDKMETTLREIEARWSDIEFTINPYEKKDNNVVVEMVPLLGIEEEDFESLENDQLLIQGMMASRYLTQFEQEVSGWQKSLFNVNEVFLLIGDIQRTWSYLEPLFIHSDEVKRELPEDSTRFITIDLDTRAVLRKAWETKNVKDAFNEKGLIDKLEGIQEQLDMCKKSLADFLDGRRRQFPRYYFVSEVDLLDILSNGGSPAKILSHISKIYLSTKTLTLSEETSATGRPSATEFVSGVGSEICTFEPAVPLEGKVEVYMQTILDAQKKSIFQTVKRSLVRYHEQSRPDWVLAKDAVTCRPLDPAQTTLLVLAINYVKETEDALTALSNGETDALVRYSEKQVSQLSDLVKLTHTDLSKGDRTKIMVCITMDAHARDIVEKMIRSKVNSVNSFMWQSQVNSVVVAVNDFIQLQYKLNHTLISSQLKHKFRVPPENARYKGRDSHLRGEGGERAEVAICDAILPYDFEYLGNGPRLVITPLTDRIYVTATQALNMKMGCAPAGMC